MIRLSLVLATAALGCGPALAQSSAPSRCAAMKDPVGCTCALATGGMASGTTWSRGPDQFAFDACVEARGGKPPAKPATIPARR